MAFPPRSPAGRLRRSAYAGVLAAAVAWGTVAAGPRGGGRGPAASPDPGAVLALLDVIDALAALDADPEVRRLRAAALDTASRREALEACADRSAADPVVAARTERLLATPAMAVYFRRFRNIDAATYRRVLLASPCGRMDAPGDVGAAFQTLLGERAAVRARLERILRDLDLTRCRDAAARFLPPGRYAVPEVRLVYDANAGSYTAGGRVYLNLYDPPGAAGDAGAPLDDPGAFAARAAHEIHHALAAPYYTFARRRRATPLAELVDSVVRAMVSEGAALQCDPPTGLRRDVWEDPVVVRALVGEIDRWFADALAGRTTLAAFEAWYAGTFHELPRHLLREFLVRTAAAEDVGAAVRRHAADRPDLVHALGWWMVSAVSDGGRDTTAVAELVKRPHELLVRYNRAVARGAVGPPVDPGVAAAVAE